MSKKRKSPNLKRPKVKSSRPYMPGPKITEYGSGIRAYMKRLRRGR